MSDRPPHNGALTARDILLAHWLATVPGHLMLVARLGRWSREHDALDNRLGRYGMGRN